MNVDGFLAHARDVEVWPLAAGVALHMLATVLRGLAWRNILAAAAGPARRVASRPIVGGYLAAAGANAVLPARAGDLFRLRVARAIDDDMRYTTLASALAVETVVDVLVTVAVIAWAIAAHVIPGAAALTWITGSPVAAVAAVAIVLAAVALAARFDGVRGRVVRGLAVMRNPASYLRRVALPQLAAWGLGIATTICVLRAFQVPATAENALRLQAAHIIATALPTGSAGIGLRGAAAVYVLAGQAGRAALIDYAVASEILLAAASIALGAAGLLLVTGLPRRRPVRQRRTTGVRPPATAPAPIVDG